MRTDGALWTVHGSRQSGCRLVGAARAGGHDRSCGRSRAEGDQLGLWWVSMRPPAKVVESVQANTSWGKRGVDPAYWAIRGREQQWIDHFGGSWRDVAAGRTGGTTTNSVNDIRGVRANHPMGAVYWTASNIVFGPLAP